MVLDMTGGFGTSDLIVIYRLLIFSEILLGVKKKNLFGKFVSKGLDKKKF